MKKMNNNNDILLTKWLNNTLTEAELKQFKTTEDYDLLVRIMDSSAKLQAPEYDVAVAYQKLKAHKNKPKAKKWWQYSVAASVILLIGFFTYTSFFSVTTYTSDFGEQLVFNLPDGSEVTLNAKSTITFNKHDWSTNRSLQLTGEAFFDVQKGKKFVVHTQQGNVSVMGTEFIVNAQTNLFKVACYEGKVKVEDFTAKTTQFLTPFKGYQHIEKAVVAFDFNEEAPQWLNNITTFKSVPLKYVFKSLEKQYNIKIDAHSFNTSQLFTGSFPNNNKEVALQTVLKSANLHYKIQENRVILQD